MGGLTVAMEEQNAKDPNFDPKTINSVKAALMGPLSGIFDSIFPGTLRIIAAGIGISLAAQGNILGPILYALIYCIPSYICRFKGDVYKRQGADKGDHRTAWRTDWDCFQLSQRNDDPYHVAAAR